MTALPVERAETVETRIERLASSGDGVGRMPDGRALFVPFTAPGDRARVEVVAEKKRFARGILREVLEPGPARVSPRCEVFGDCGGCRWQHLDYAEQLRAKRSILVDAVERIGHLSLPENVSMIASPSPYAYRGRARLHSEKGEVGHLRAYSHSVCPVRTCPVLVPQLDEALRSLAARMALEASGLPTDEASGGTGDAALLLREWELAAGTASLRCAPVEGPDAKPIELRVGEDSLRLSPGVFHQGNALLLDALQGAVVEAACSGIEPQHATAVELYSGAGFFTLALARRFARVVAVESHPPAVADLEANLTGLAGELRLRVDPRCSRVAEALEALAREGTAPPAVVVLDPPRAGLSPKALVGLVALGAARVVYLSCDPATLARDLAALSSRGYQLDALTGFDLFPQTPHVEALAVLGIRAR